MSTSPLSLHDVFRSSLDEDTGQVLTRTPTGEYPDGLAYDPRRAAIWTTNETGGSETVIDAVNGAARGTVALGAEAGRSEEHTSELQSRQTRMPSSA